ncbi:MAG: ACP S-malonyltransferase [Xanthomonadales bacterium]|nr:ACP S-malonyltransferase [Xanthomonadales bacterium]
MLAFVFPGQGSQSVGMLGDFADEAIVRQCFDEAGQAISLDLWALAQQGPDSALNETANTQPALLAADVALWRLWRARGGAAPALLAGHSLGEFAALVAADVLDLADATRLVRVRGQAMQAAVPAGTGAMVAVLNADPTVIDEVCAEVAGDEVVSAANLNAPGQIVIAGHASAVERAKLALQERGVRRVLPLPVSVPSHCALMAPAAAALQQALSETRLRAPQIPVLHNVDAQARIEPTAIATALVEQLCQPVRWTDTMAALRGAGIDRLVECGPGKVLAGLARRGAEGVEAYALTSANEFASTLEALT